MLKARAACLSCCLLAFTSQASATFDGHALIQQELRHSQAPGPKMRVSPKTVVRDVVTAITRQLDGLILKHEVDLNKTIRMREFTEKHTNHSADKPLLLADLSQQGDSELVVMMLGFLRDPAFLKAAQDGVKGLSKALAAFSLRTEKQVTSLLLASETSSKEEMPKHVAEFFAKEVHIIQTIVDLVLDTFSKMLTAAPGYEAVVGEIATPLVNHVKSATAARLNRLRQSYVDSGGSSFCDHPLLEFTKEVIPTLLEVEQKVPMLEAFVQAQVPDAAPAASELLHRVAEMSSKLADRLKEDIRLAAQKVCGIIGVPVAKVPEPSEFQ